MPETSELGEAISTSPAQVNTLIYPSKLRSATQWKMEPLQQALTNCTLQVHPLEDQHKSHHLLTVWTTECPTVSVLGELDVNSFRFFSVCWFIYSFFACLFCFCLCLNCLFFSPFFSFSWIQKEKNVFLFYFLIYNNFYYSFIFCKFFILFHFISFYSIIYIF